MPNSSHPDAQALPAAGLGRRSWAWNLFAGLMAVVVVAMLATALGIRYWLWPELAQTINSPQRLAQSVGPALDPLDLELRARDARAEWADWLSPRLVVGEAELVQRSTGEVVASVEGLSADFGLRTFYSLTAGIPIFSQLGIERLKLRLHRKADGRLVLAGVALSPDSDKSSGPMLEAIQWQGPLSVIDARLIWQDDLHADQTPKVKASKTRPPQHKPADPSVAQQTGQGEMRLKGLYLKLRAGQTQLRAQGFEAAELVSLLSMIQPMPAMRGALGPVRLDWAGDLGRLGSQSLGQWLDELSADISFRELSHPAISGLSGRVLLGPKTGSLVVSGQGMALNLPQVFPASPLRIEKLGLEGEWSASGLLASLAEQARLPSDFNFRLASGSLQLPQADLKLSGSYNYAGQGLGEAAMEGSLTDLLPEQVHQLLPAQIGPQTRAWIDRGIRQGNPVSGRFELKGALEDFPFRDGRKGLFKAQLRLEDQRILFARGWPDIESADIDLRFDGPSLQFVGREAVLGKASIVEVRGEIIDILSEDPMLLLSGEIAGDLGGMVQTANQSPVRRWLGQALDDAEASGQGNLALELRVPLNRASETTVKGELALKGSGLRLGGSLPALTQLEGRLLFSDRGFHYMAVQARSLGGRTQLSMGQEPAQGVQSPAVSRLVARGNFQSVELMGWLRESMGLPLSKAVVSGASSYQIEADIKRSELQLQIRSSLVGMGIALPAPLGKAANEDWGLSVRMSQTSFATGQRQQSWQLTTVANRLTGLVDSQRLRPGQPQQLRAGLSWGEQAKLPAGQGLVLNLAAESLELNDWLNALNQYLEDPPLRPDSPSPAQVSGQEDLRAIFIRAQQVRFADQLFSRVRAEVTPEKGRWRVDLDSAQVAGRLVWDPSPSETQAAGESSGNLVARLSRLWLPPGQQEKPEATATDSSASSSSPAAESNPAAGAALLPPAMLTSLAQARRWPRIDLQADDFRRGQKDFGRLRLEASPSRLQPQWDISSLVIENPQARFEGSGQWAALSLADPLGLSQTRLQFVLSVVNGGRLLDRLGYPGLLRATPGSLRGNVGWPGAPIDFQLRAFNGQLDLDLQSGQFLKADPGIGKLVSVINLQSLPKRIALDFRDIFSEGFNFERVRGNVSFESGLAKTTNLRLVGVQASVFLEGSANVLKETQALRVLVLPELNTGLASLGYALVNPAVGLGSILAQYVLRDPLRQTLAYEFEVTGKWDDPSVKSLPRRPPADSNQPSDAASSPSMPAPAGASSSSRP